MAGSAELMGVVEDKLVEVVEEPELGEKLEKLLLYSITVSEVVGDDAARLDVVEMEVAITILDTLE